MVLDKCQNCFKIKEVGYCKNCFNESLIRGIIESQKGDIEERVKFYIDEKFDKFKEAMELLLKDKQIILKNGKSAHR